MSVFRPVYSPGWNVASSRNQVPQAPTQFIPKYPGEAVSSTYKSLLSSLNRITTERPFDFQAQPITWQDIRSREVSARAAADESLGYNMENEAIYAGMAQRMTAADTAVREEMLDRFVPQWRTQRDTAGAINESMMKGEIPRDVANRLQRDAAFIGLQAGGYGGGANTRSVTARDLGLTSLDLQQRGMAGAERWTTMMAGLMPEQTTAAGIMATQGMTPQMALETSLQNAANQLTADVTNVQGRVDAGFRTQDIGLRSAMARSETARGWAGMQADAQRSVAEGYTSNLLNKYIADMQAGQIQFGNLNRPYQSYREGLGLQAGQRQRTGFGL
jgi:hypothetical protein